MVAWLTGELTTIALCWRIERRDGVTIGLTGHDRDLEVDGLVYRAAPGMTPSAVRRRASFGARSSNERRSLAARRSAAPSSARRAASPRLAAFAT